MKHNMIIRTEQPEDHNKVEALTREAFYNMYMPGCVEHYLVRLMREHEDFIPELDFVAELDGKIIGNIMYTKAKLTDDNGAVKEILTFGPVSIHPDYQMCIRDRTCLCTSGFWSISYHMHLQWDM